MKLQTVDMAFFSPTGTTRSVLSALAKGMGVEHVNLIDLTLPEAERQEAITLTGNAIVLGVPVYKGRLPEEAVRRLRKLSAQGTPVIPVVVYGNREYDDALLELVNVSQELGMRPVAGAAFIGEHSYSTIEHPIAANRPDASDLEKACEFGKRVAEKLAAVETVEELQLPNFPGNFPYLEPPEGPVAAPEQLDDNCGECGICVESCPVGAITIDSGVHTHNEDCIWCCACVKNCPSNARAFTHPLIGKITDMLLKVAVDRKEPECFLPGI